MSGEDAQAATTSENENALDKILGAATKEKEADKPATKAKADPVDESALKEAEEKEDAERGDTSSLPDDPDALKREIAKLRRENAARRTQKKEVEEAAQKWQEYVDSQKTELEKLTDENSKLKQENSRLTLEKAQFDLAKKYGVDDDLVEFITGSDLDEMKEKAKKLAARSSGSGDEKKKTTTADDLRAGQKTAPKTQAGGADLLKQLWNSR